MAVVTGTSTPHARASQVTDGSCTWPEGHRRYAARCIKCASESVTELFLQGVHVVSGVTRRRPGTSCRRPPWRQNVTAQTSCHRPLDRMSPQGGGSGERGMPARAAGGRADVSTSCAQRRLGACLGAQPRPVGLPPH